MFYFLVHFNQKSSVKSGKFLTVFNIFHSLLHFQQCNMELKLKGMGILIYRQSPSGEQCLYLLGNLLPERSMQERKNTIMLYKDQKYYQKTLL